MADVSGWKVATVERVDVETPLVKSFWLRVEGLNRFRPGQHVDIRLRAPDGYEAQRSYSIASAPGERGLIQLTVEHIADGEVSPYLHNVVREGDQFEVRGPIGGPFTWTGGQRGHLLLVGGGSGVVPLMSMLRHRATISSSVDDNATLLYSARNAQEIIYRNELETMACHDASLGVFFTLTREQPGDWHGFSRRIDAQMLDSVITGTGEPADCYVCGPTEFVESVASALADRGLPGSSIRTERFGPSGT